MSKNKNKLLTTISIVGLSIVLLTACDSGISSSSSSHDSSGTYSSGSYEYTESEAIQNFENKTYDYSTTNEARRKTKAYSMLADTKTFDETKDAINNLVTEYKGFVDNANYDSSGNKTIDMVMFVPAESSQDFVTQIKSIDGFHVLAERETAEDLEREYVDVDTKLTALNNKLEKLYELQKNTNDTERLEEIESNISNTISSIEQLKGYKVDLDEAIQYSRVELTLSEVGIPKKEDQPLEPSFKDELAGELSGTLRFYKNILKILIIYLVRFGPLILIFLACYIPYKKRTNKRIEKMKAKGSKSINKSHPNNNKMQTETPDKKETKADEGPWGN